MEEGDDDDEMAEEEEEDDQEKEPEVQFHRAITGGLARLTMELAPPKRVKVCSLHPPSLAVFKRNRPAESLSINPMDSRLIHLFHQSLFFSFNHTTFSPAPPHQTPRSCLFLHTTPSHPTTPPLIRPFFIVPVRPFLLRRHLIFDRAFPVLITMKTPLPNVVVTRTRS
jgi:hypothetical protein